MLSSQVHLGFNWGQSFDRGHNWRDTVPDSAAARELAEALFQHNAVVDDKLCNPAISFLLAEMALRYQWNVRLDVSLLSISSNRVLIRDVSGTTEYHAQRIIDARPAYPNGKVLTAVFQGESDLPEQNGDGYTIRPGFWKDQYDLKLQLSADCTWQDARKHVARVMADLKAKNIPLKLALIETCFAENRFANAIEEFNFGTRMGEEA